MPVKTVTKAKVITINEALVIMTEKMAESRAYLEKKIAESDAKIAESDAKMAESRAYLEKSIAESDAKIAESQAKTDLAIQKLTESQTKTDLAIQGLTETVEKLTLRVDEVLTGFSTVGNRFGELVEFLVVPGLRRAINEYNKHEFKRSIANKSFYYVGRNGQKQKITEVDLLLTNGSEAMAVEVKATLRRDYVDNHLKRLKKLREFAKETGLEKNNCMGRWWEYI
jgi:hypothetical protein